MAGCRKHYALVDDKGIVKKKAKKKLRMRKNLVSCRGTILYLVTSAECLHNRVPKVRKIVHQHVELTRRALAVNADALRAERDDTLNSLFTFRIILRQTVPLEPHAEARRVADFADLRCYATVTRSS